MRRVYHITKRTHTGLLLGEWVTTNCFAAMTFTHASGYGNRPGFYLWSQNEQSEEIIDMKQIVIPT